MTENKAIIYMEDVNEATYFEIKLEEVNNFLFLNNFIRKTTI